MIMRNFFAFQYMSFCVLIFSSLLSFQSLAQPANDDPCNATPLTLSTSCNFVSGTTVGATATGGVPAPGCASYGGPDVWYSVVVPASGAMVFDSNIGTITDAGMAVYSGTCSSLTLLNCNDDGSANGLMPMINLTGQTPGTTLYLRFWKYGSGTGTFNICAKEVPAAPPCGTSPAAGDACSSATPICDLNGYCGNTSSSYGVDSWTQLTSTFCGSIENNSFLSFTPSSSTISFDIWVNSSTLGYGIQILLFSATNCTGPVTQYGPCYNPGTVSLGAINFTATGLTPGNTYYIMIDGNSGDVCNYTIGVSGSGSGILIPVDISPDNITICNGESVPLSVTGGNGTYNWVPDPALSATTGANVTATPPSTPGTYTYTVNSTGGNPLCPSSTTATATIIVNPCNCSVTATNSGPICSGAGTVNLFATTTARAIYSWTGPNGFTSTDQNPTSVVIPTTPGTYAYTVSMINNGDTCTSTTNVLVGAPPAVGAGIDRTACNGASVTLSGSGAVSYTWDNGVTNGVAFNPITTTTYTVTGTDANGCTNTDVVTVTVSTSPIIGAGIDQTTCPGGSIILTGTGGVSYTWNNSVTNGISFVPATTATYTVTGTDAFGCQNTDQVLVTVYALPAIDAGQPQAVCPGGSVILTGAGGVSYTWNNGITNGVSFIPAATTTYTVTGTDANNCQNTDQVVVTVNPLPNVDAGQPQAICMGQSVTLNGSGAQSYSWNNGITNGVSFVPSATATYIVTGTDANGCQNIDQVVVTVNALPNVSAGADQAVCEGMPVVLSGSGAQSYSWNNGVSNGVSFTPPLGMNSYTVTGTDAFGCQNSATVMVSVVLIPTAIVDATTPTSGNPILTVQFTNSSLNSSSFDFDYGNGQSYQTTSVSSSPSESYTTPGTYTVILTASNGICQDTAQIQVVVIPYQPLLVVVPNIFTPNGDGNNDVFFVKLENATSLDLTIVNRWGNFMAKISAVNGFWDGTVNSNLADEGVYFYQYTVSGLDGTIQTGQGDIQLMHH
jgi:gliding motility-associated-like protein